MADGGAFDFDSFDTEVSEAMGRYNAAGASLVAVVGRCIAEGWWHQVETNSPEHWVMARCGLDRGRAHQLVRLARNLDQFPATAALFADGRITEAQAAVIVGCDPAADDAMAACAPACNVGQLRRIARAYPKPEPAAHGDDDDRGVESDPADSLTFGWTDAGRFQGGFDLGAQAGAMVETALRAARRTLFRERTGTDADVDDDDETHHRTDRSIDWAAALERLGLAGLDGLDPATRAGGRPGDRYQVLLHLDDDHPETARVHLGPVLSRADRDLLTCDAEVRSILWRHGRPVSQGRRRRVVDPILRALVEDRDGGCRVCGAVGFLHIHHLVHWTDGGPTDDDNLVALCTTCHRRVHHGHLRISGDPVRLDGLVFLDRTGRPLPSPAATPPVDRSPPPTRFDGPIRGERIDYRCI